ncbi:Uncharacterised protein [uncultured archaeon]|nr:Uncharacterised protein [uncultured archaeon]
MKQIGLLNIETKIRIRDAIKADKRDLYLVVSVKLLKTEEKLITGCWVTPLAMLIVEQEMKYAFSIDGQDMPMEEILELAPSLKMVIDNADCKDKINIE